MTKTTAIRLVSKLQALANDKSATRPEAQLAAEKARSLIAKFNLDAQPEAPKATSAPKTTPRRAQPRPVYPMPPTGGWGFDWRTGQAHGDIKVHHYRNPRDWKIEIPVR